MTEQPQERNEPYLAEPAPGIMDDEPVSGTPTYRGARQESTAPLTPGKRCIGNNPTCPCQDGDACHYVTIGDSPGWRYGTGLPPWPRDAV